jgi:hypothetical protein
MNGSGNNWPAWKIEATFAAELTIGIVTVSLLNLT